MKNFPTLYLLSLAAFLNSIELSSQSQKIHPDPDGFPVRQEPPRIEPPMIEPLEHEIPQNHVPLHRQDSDIDRIICSYEKSNHMIRRLKKGRHLIARHDGMICGIVFGRRIFPVYRITGRKFTVEVPVHYWQSPEATPGITLDWEMIHGEQ